PGQRPLRRAPRSHPAQRTRTRRSPRRPRPCRRTRPRPPPLVAPPFQAHHETQNGPRMYSSAHLFFGIHVFFSPFKSCVVILRRPQDAEGSQRSVQANPIRDSRSCTGAAPLRPMSARSKPSLALSTFNCRLSTTSPPDFPFLLTC